VVQERQRSMSKEHALGEQLELELDWGREPWQGRTPRSLCNVDKSVTLPKPARVDAFFTDPAQLQLWVTTSFEKEV